MRRQRRRRGGGRTGDGGHVQVLSNERAWGGVRRGGEEQDEREGDTHNGAVPYVIAEHSYWLVKTGARKGRRPISSME